MCEQLRIIYEQLPGTLYKTLYDFYLLIFMVYNLIFLSQFRFTEYITRVV